jgi:hypothetical protein
MSRPLLVALSVLPLAAQAEEPAPLTPEFLEFLAEEPAAGDGMEEALMSREIERALATARAARKAQEGDDDER